MSDNLPDCPGGYFTNGMVTPTGSDLSANSRVPVDTGLPNGQSPQTGGMIPGTLPAPAAQLGLTAAADGAKADATPLGYGVNTLTTVAGANDSVLLPFAYPGAVVFVANTVATAAQVFGKGTDTVDGVATATGVTQGASKRCWYVGITGSGDGSDAGSWLSLVGAATT